MSPRGNSACIKNAVMNSNIERLLELQISLQSAGPRTPDRTKREQELRASVSPSILDYFDRRIKSCGRAVARVEHGVCGACHMRLPLSVAAALAQVDNVVLCETCGCFLVLSQHEDQERRATFNANRLERIRHSARMVRA